MKICSVEGCEAETYRTKEYCRKHYRRLQAHGDPLGGKLSPGEPARIFFEMVQKETDDCIIWPLSCIGRPSRGGRGYGIVTIEGKEHKCHIYACEMVNGPKPEEKSVVRHTCGNGNHACFNPKHLLWGTHTENMHDRILHETSSRGEQHPNVILDEESVSDIYYRSWNGEKVKDLAEFYNVHPTTISNIKRGHSWSWFTGHKTGRKRNLLPE